MTQNERILWILSDGGWHEKSEFYGFCVLHSRVSELRHKHHKTIEIEKRDGGRTVWYRLVPRVESEADCLGPDGSLSTGETGDVGEPAVTGTGRGSSRSGVSTAEATGVSGQPPYPEAVPVRCPSQPTQLTLIEAA